ncbi:hypothetical protein SAMN05444396_101414 [Flavobacterium segetis]|uniref:Uncharacterized protein n=1 Tax=Flavobacterium segetis TaxID=271157 RepID=A0A1M5EJ96_9FLAO|nr:hypothetical protein SAMN05444396_101414 [Flavobacterium segetis]
MMKKNKANNFRFFLTTFTINNKNINMKLFILKWYPIILAFICMLYSITLGILGREQEALYSAHWPGTILLFAIAIRQRRTT